jgi:menaquinone-dependent protoporphyrinogen oxidase
MHILIAVASKHGSTHEIAQAIGAEIRAHNIMADVCDAGAVTDLTPYDAVVLGSGIYAGSWLPDAKLFATRHHAALQQRPVWVFSSGPLGDDDPQPHDNPERLAAPLAGVPIRDHQIFVGKLDTSALSFAERLITRVVMAPDGDFRDWEAVRDWATSIAAAVEAPVG